MPDIRELRYTILYYINIQLIRCTTLQNCSMTECEVSLIIIRRKTCNCTIMYMLLQIMFSMDTKFSVNNSQTVILWLSQWVSEIINKIPRQTIGFTKLGYYSLRLTQAPCAFRSAISVSLFFSSVKSSFFCRLSSDTIATSGSVRWRRIWPVNRSDKAVLDMKFRLLLFIF